jgi:hypothetical protein
MDLTRLKEVLASFADDPASLIVEKSRLVVQIQDELITATTFTRDGTLYVTEEGETLPAPRWVATRIAQLDLVADRIAGLFPINPKFVEPAGILLDQIEECPDDTGRPVDSAVKTAEQFLGRKPGGVCSVLYLTSDAGEGKTTLINHLARRQALAYRKRSSDWLLLPFSLGGNTFLRLDNVIAAGLLNQLRIRRFFIDGLFHLIRMGYIVPALDGFEEVFVEGSGEAVSSLGNLIRDLRGEGSLLIAARTAYFEFKRMDRQARLFDTIPNFEVGFGRLSLSRWGKREFTAYCELDDVPNPDQLYQDLSDRLGREHALLTRAFFVSRIADLAKTVDGAQFLRDIQPKVQDSFRPFIDRILEREVREKWIDKFSQPAEPLLKLEEHHQLLRLLAEEMWTSKRGSLPRTTSDDLADIYCEVNKKTPAVTRQIRERLPNHALLVADVSGTQIAFDHDHFREFFLGEQLGEYIRTRAAADVRKLLRMDAVAAWTLDSAVALALRAGEAPSTLLKTVIEVSATEGPTSFVRENGGALCLRIAEKLAASGHFSNIASMTFPEDGLAGRVLKDLRFMKCYFRSTLVSGAMSNIEFEQCEMEHIEVEDEFSFQAVKFVDCQIHGLTITRGDQVVDFYDPAIIETYLSRAGASLIKASQAVLPTGQVPEDEEQIKIVRKLLQVFKRTTQVSDSVITLRLGVHASAFFADVSADLLGADILRRVKNRGGGTQLRFRLGRSMAAIADALAESRGSYAAFLQLMRDSARGRLEDDGEEDGGV